MTEEKQPVELGNDNETIAGQGTDITIVNKKVIPNNYCTSCNAQPEADSLTTLKFSNKSKGTASNKYSMREFKASEQVTK